MRTESSLIWGDLLLIAFVVTASMGSQRRRASHFSIYLLFYALIIQICLLYLKLEYWAEAKVIALFQCGCDGHGNIFNSSANYIVAIPTACQYLKYWLYLLFAGFMFLQQSGSFFAPFLAFISGFV